MIPSENKIRVGFVLKYLISKFFGALFILWIVFTICFFLLKSIPGGPLENESAFPENIQTQLNQHFLLNKPVLQQYVHFLQAPIQGDWLSSSRYSSKFMAPTIVRAAYLSFLLGLAAILFALLLAIPLSIAFYNKGRRILELIILSSLSVPQFILAAVLIALFFGTPIKIGLAESSTFFILPMFVLAWRPIGLIIQTMFLQFDLLSSKDFVRTAKAKGLSEAQILTHHLLPIALPSVLALLGPLMASVLSGSFVVESIFSIPGLGRFMINSALARDYPLFCSLTIFYSAYVIVIHFVTESAISLFNPVVGGSNEIA